MKTILKNVFFSDINKMADKNNQNLNEDGWNDGSNYDRIQNLLQDVDSTKADAKVALTGAERKKLFQDVPQDIKKVVELEVNQVQPAIQLLTVIIIQIN